MTANQFPRLNDRARGWLRFTWDKATTPDDWSSAGEPHPWWDRYSSPPLCSLARLDLDGTGPTLAVLSDVTPAWREAYVRVADELVGRYTTFWAASDWLTQIGHDPHQDNYPPEWMTYMSEHLRGRYDGPGWCANGIEPWGLQPDPIGADGILSHRGFLNLLLSVYTYVGGDDKWEKPFSVTGYQDRRFEWDHHSIAELIHDQWATQPAGVHCENTKIWPFCVAGTGLGLQMYDAVHSKATHHVFREWVAYARKHYMKLDRRGALRWFAFYHDPLEQTVYRLRDDVFAYASLCITPFVLPQDREFGTLLYESSVRTLGWDDPKKPLLQLHPDPRFAGWALLVARELGDSTTEARLRELVERECEPRFFSVDETGTAITGQDRFGWWLNNGEPWPRGQHSALLLLAELAEPGGYLRVFNEPNLAKFDEPTVEGVDFPDLGIAQAWNDPTAGCLWLETYVATTSTPDGAAGRPTTWRVTQLPDPEAVTVECDGNTLTAWEVAGRDSIEIRTDIAPHRFRVQTGYHGQAPPPGAVRSRIAPSVAAKTVYVPAGSPGSSCCGP